MARRAYAKYYHQPVVAFPDIRDVAGLLFESAREGYDFTERLQAQMVGGVNGNNINSIKNRLNYGTYPLGWPEVLIFKGHTKTAGANGEEAEKEEMEVPEILLEAFPCSPIRIGGINAGTPGFPVEKLRRGNVNSYGLAFGTDINAALNGILNDRNVDPAEIDNVFFSPTMRFWDVAEPTKRYMFDLFKTLIDNDIVGLSEEEQEDTRVEDGSKHFNFSNLTTISVRHEEVYNQGFGFAYLGNYDISWGDIQSPETVFYYNKDKFHPNGELKEEYYASSIDLYLTCGYIAYNAYNVRAFMATGRTHRAEPLVPDNHPRRYRLRVDSPVTARIVVRRPPGEDGTPGGEELVTTLLPGRTYERIDEYTLEEIIPEIQNEDLGGTLEGEIGTARIDIRYYPVHEGGVEVIRVVNPIAWMNTAAIDDEEEFFGLVGGAVDLENINEAAVPFFPAIVAEYKPHNKSDVFAASWHVTITTYDIVTYSGSNWFMMAIQAIALASYIFMPALGGAVGAAVTAQVATRAATAFAMFVIAKIAYGIFADIPLLAAAIVIGAGLAMGGYAQLSSMFSNMAAELPQLLIKFGQMLDQLMTGVYQQQLQGVVSDIEDLQEQYNQMLEESGYVERPTMLMDPSLFIDETSYVMEPPKRLVTPQTSMDQFLDFPNVGVNILDPQREIDESLQLDLIR